MGLGSDEKLGFTWLGDRTMNRHELDLRGGDHLEGSEGGILMPLGGILVAGT